MPRRDRSHQNIFPDERAISAIVEQAALDEYVFLREAYLQRRQSQVYDGNPPQPDFDLFDEESQEGEPPAETPPATPAP